MTKILRVLREPEDAFLVNDSISTAGTLNPTTKEHGKIICTHISRGCGHWRDKEGGHRMSAGIGKGGKSSPCAQHQSWYLSKEIAAKTNVRCRTK